MLFQCALVFCLFLKSSSLGGTSGSRVHLHWNSVKMRNDHFCSCYEWILPNWQMTGHYPGSAPLLRSSDSHHTQKLTCSRVNKPSKPEISSTFIFISSRTVLLSSFTVHNEKGWQKPQNSARRFSFLVFFGLCIIQGRSFFPGMSRSSLPCFGLSCWIISCVLAAVDEARKR